MAAKKRRAKRVLVGRDYLSKKIAPILILGAITFLAQWSIALFEEPVKGFIFNLFQDDFVKWGAGLMTFAVLSDVFFTFVVRK